MIFGLDEITFGELRSSQKLMDALRQKVGDLNPDKFADRELARKANLLIDLLRETLLDRYQALTLRAFAHITVALDYFLILHEREPGAVKDTLPGGYLDDLQRVNHVCKRFEKELQAFETWRQRQPPL